MFCCLHTALDLKPQDPKALFRRCQANEALEKYEEAYKDIAMVFKLDPKNAAIQPVLRRLGPIIQKRVSVEIVDVVNVSLINIDKYHISRL